jgi:hypothetical protein
MSVLIGDRDPMLSLRLMRRLPLPVHQIQSVQPILFCKISEKQIPPDCEHNVQRMITEVKDPNRIVATLAVVVANVGGGLQRYSTIPEGHRSDLLYSAVSFFC